MTSKERAALRAKANPLEPIFQIGKDGVSDNLTAQIDDALDVRELCILKLLLKVRENLQISLQNHLMQRLFRLLAALLLFTERSIRKRSTQKRKHA